jgi:hypothetical protein
MPHHKEIDAAMQEFRHEYQSICLLNNALPIEVRLPSEALEGIDYIFEEFHRDEFRKGAQEIGRVQGEKNTEIRRRLSLLQDTFVGPCDNFFVKGLKVDSIVRTFPVLKTSSEMLDLRKQFLNEKNDSPAKEESKQDCVEEDCKVAERENSLDEQEESAQDECAHVNSNLSRKVSAVLGWDHSSEYYLTHILLLWRIQDSSQKKKS